MGEKLLLIGGGGHALSVIDSLSHGDFDEIGIVDRFSIDSSLLPFPILGEDSDLANLFSVGYSKAFISVGSVGETEVRVSLFEQLSPIGFQLINVIDETAEVSPSVIMGTGIYVGCRAIINAASSIGNMAIINTGAIVEHQCKIGDFAHIAPGAILCANVTVGAHSHIGAGSVVKQGVTIGENTTIGIGSVITKDTASNVIAYGNPCKIVRKEDSNRE